MSTLPSPRASLAAQVAAQNRPVSITPIRPVIQPPSDAPITICEMDQRFRVLVLKQRKTVGEMAYISYRLWEANAWESLGYADQDAYCEALGLFYPYWRKLVSLGERLRTLTLFEIQGLTLGAMEALTKVLPVIWHEFSWVEEAKALATREFVMLVVQRNQTASRGLSGLSEPKTELRLRVPISQHPVFERRLEALRRQERLSSVAEALTFALESVDRADLLADTVAEIQSQVSELKRLYESESPEEREARLDGKTGVGVKAQGLLRKIDRTIGGVADALPEKEISSPDSGETVSTV